MQRTYTLGPRTFVLDQAKAEAALAAKRVVGGRETMTFNLLPLRYGWAYELYRAMKANHWEPEDVPMQRDVEQWRSRSALSDIDRWIVRMGVGYFSAAEGIVGDNIIHVVRELVTASELKLVLGRHAHEENIHADSLLYMISSLGIDPHECEAMFADVPTIVAKNAFVTDVSRALRRDVDLDDPDALRLLARNVFVFGQCMEGTQFYGLFGMILSLYRQGKLPGIGTMFRYTPLNLFLPAPDLKAMSHMYRAAWHAGLKTTYYLRTLGASAIEKSTVSAPAAVACSIEAMRNGEECEACQ